MNAKIIEYAASNRERFNTLQELHAHLVEVFASDAPAYSTMTERLRRHAWADRPAAAPQQRGPKIDLKLADDIRKLLRSNPDLSSNQIATRLRKPATTVKSYLHNVLHLEFKNEHWIPQCE